MNLINQLCRCIWTELTITKLKTIIEFIMNTWDFRLPEYLLTPLRAEDYAYFNEMVIQPYEDERSSVFLEWTIALKTWIKQNNIIIQSIEYRPSTSNWTKNTIYLQIEKNENKAQALIHHLRNSYCHSRIYQDDNYYLFEDYNSHTNKTTMKGCIEKGKLKNLINLLYDQIQGKMDRLLPTDDII